MIGPDMAAVFVVEHAAQQFCERTQQAIPLHEAVLLVVILHPAKIDEQERGVSPLLSYRAASDLGQLEEIHHAGKPRQIVVPVRLQDALFMERVAHEPVELRASPFLVFSFLHIPDMGNLNACFGNYMLADRMDDHVFLASRNPCPINHIIPAVLGGGKLHGRIAKARDVVRMDLPVHIVIHVMIRLRAVLISEQFAKTVRKGECDDLPVPILIDGKRLLQAFHEGFLFLREFVSFHAKTPPSPVFPESVPATVYKKNNSP